MCPKYLQANASALPVAHGLAIIAALVVTLRAMLTLTATASDSVGHRALALNAAPRADSLIYLPFVARNATPVSPRCLWRDTTSGIHVFNDQLAASMPDA